MARAAVLIGVSRSGDLPRLEAVLPGIRSMQSWSRDQGFATVTTLTDEAGELQVRAIQDAVAGILRRGPVDQLLVYFAGHGVNVGRSEYWLLSDAPTYTSEAVNVEGSAYLARACGIPHVVFFSDACRTAAEGIRMQSVRGTDIFPNDDVGAPNQPVDRFYACALGSPAFEVKDAQTAADRFEAVYTAVLFEALNGQPKEVLDWESDGGCSVGLVRPWPLRDHLEEEVGRRLARLVPSGELIQNPEAVITSPPSAWLSRLESLSRPPRRRGPVAPSRGPSSLAAVTRAALHDQLHNELTGPSAPLIAAAERGVPGAGVLLGASERAAARVGSDHVETRCGFTVRGTELASVWSPAAAVEVLGPQLARVDLPGGDPATVLLEFSDRTGVALPALDGFIAAITVERGELVDVAYEPSASSWRFSNYLGRLDELRSLRSLVSCASRLGTFRLPGQDAETVAVRMQVAKGVDPSMALYAAYAYHELQRDDLLRETLGYLAADVGVALFDVALLAGAMTRRGAGAPVAPMVPMLAQGWALLDALRVRLPAPAAELRGHLVPALWTQFDATGLGLARDALRSARGRL